MMDNMKDVVGLSKDKKQAVDRVELKCNYSPVVNLGADAVGKFYQQEQELEVMDQNILKVKEDRNELETRAY